MGFDHYECSVALEGRGSLIVKVTDSWLACHEFDPPCTGSRCTLNMSRFECPPISRVWKIGEGDERLGVIFVT
ncbi:hypothetical protein TNCV_2471651 [Trichonephila clavipes]|nr:hypothetical protein TNCV_2471651 [Trichonephila clavipes]